MNCHHVWRRYCLNRLFSKETMWSETWRSRFIKRVHKGPIGPINIVKKTSIPQKRKEKSQRTYFPSISSYRSLSKTTFGSWPQIVCPPQFKFLTNRYVCWHRECILNREDIQLTVGDIKIIWILYRTHFHASSRTRQTRVSEKVECKKKALMNIGLDPQLRIHQIRCNLEP